MAPKRLWEEGRRFFFLRDQVGDEQGTDVDWLRKASRLWFSNNAVSVDHWSQPTLMPNMRLLTGVLTLQAEYWYSLTAAMTSCDPVHVRHHDGDCIFFMAGFVFCRKGLIPFF